MYKTWKHFLFFTDWIFTRMPGLLGSHLEGKAKQNEGREKKDMLVPMFWISSSSTFCQHLAWRMEIKRQLQTGKGSPLLLGRKSNSIRESASRRKVISLNLWLKCWTNMWRNVVIWSTGLAWRTTVLQQARAHLDQLGHWRWCRHFWISHNDLQLSSFGWLSRPSGGKNVWPVPWWKIKVHLLWSDQPEPLQVQPKTRRANWGTKVYFYRWLIEIVHFTF